MPKTENDWRTRPIICQHYYTCDQQGRFRTLSRAEARRIIRGSDYLNYRSTNDRAVATWRVNRTTTISVARIRNFFL